MGFKDMLGTKLELSKPYSIEELYELIKDVPFEAGKPEIAKHGPATLIVFPQLDRNNQVQIMGKNGDFTSVRSVQPAGLDKAFSNIALDHMTNGLSGFSGAFGKTKKLCYELARKVAEQINAMHL